MSLIYENGTNNISTNSSTIGFAGGIGIASTSTSGISQSILAQKVSPPKKNSYLLAALVIGLGAIFLCNIIYGLTIKNAIFGLIGIFLLGFGIKIFRVNYKYNSNIFPKKYLEWTKTWHCNKCGNTYLN
ncbi:hypothetical protein ACE193_24030 [Bernardetia sp. OM2101]|uniref:hypothetical protein n=1 Tax=Bernardetia sp. OM2101 TaxID=3344876 RepID=UPI0035CF7118